MATTRKILGQNVPSATLSELIYTVPDATQVVVSSIICCNFSAVDDELSIAVVPSGGAVATSTLVYYRLPISMSDTFTATVGITLNAGDMIYVYSQFGGVSFSIFGQEIT